MKGVVQDGEDLRHTYINFKQQEAQFSKTHVGFDKALWKQKIEHLASVTLKNCYRDMSAYEFHQHQKVKVKHALRRPQSPSPMVETTVHS
tara:strand:- start:53 stop:322 length:270 start_codon:yes stop_codon:yes gene_type:complete